MLPPLALPPGVQNHIGPSGAAAFRERLAEAVRARAALGDSGLDVARRLELDDRIRWLEARIATFVITSPPERPSRVSFGCAVTVAGERGERTFRLVGVDEADSAERISWWSPLARALTGAAVGDEVVVRTPRGEEVVEVLAIEG